MVRKKPSKKFKKEHQEKTSEYPMVECQICGHMARCLTAHLKHEHDMTGKEYSNLYPDAPLFADDLMEKFKVQAVYGKAITLSGMDWGMKNRLSKIIRPETGRTVMLAVDHGYFLGPTSGLEKPRKTIVPLLKYADALMLTRGILRNCIPPENAPPIVLRISGGTSILKELSNEGITADIEDCIRLNVSAITLSIFVGADGERESLLNLSKLVDWGEKYGIPVLAVTAVGKDMARDARYLGLACRIAAELGAHFVKTYYCDDFEKVVESTPVPIVIAGGKKTPEKEALELAYNAVTHGAVGVDMGRNIFQSDSPIGMIKAVRAVVHDNLSPKDAYQIYLNEKKSK